MESPTEQDIDECLEWCAKAEEHGTNYHGMSYEQGVRDGIDWLRGHGSDPSDA